MSGDSGEAPGLNWSVEAVAEWKCPGSARTNSARKTEGNGGMTMVDNANRRAKLRKLWFEQFPDEAERTGNQVLQFTMWAPSESAGLVAEGQG